MGKVIRENACSIIQQYCKQVSRIPEVASIYFLGETSVIHLWTVVSDLNDEITDKIYEVEEFLEAHYPDQLFDFFILKAGDLAPSDIPTGFKHHQPLWQATQTI